MATFWIYLIADSNTDKRVVYHVDVHDYNEDIPIEAERFFKEAKAKNIGNDIEDVTNTLRQWWELLPEQVRRRVKVSPNDESIQPVTSVEDFLNSTDFIGLQTVLFNPKLSIR
ncbi:hypothetical protein [Spirosoma endophyticum]|uniref:Uncharacterized protein n=1 Tax=Spirosoma endophyticum TaxID=662367 RepID=A0A1I1SNP6_9BACT|nr:hypothetical protein [Spirosoma endophyticum]SFD46348.1 hypothetical protein SAMN05216167_105125 [Spirosoma endophyticum]